MDAETFKKKEDAEIEAKKFNDNYTPMVFCPLAKEICRKDCVCFKAFYAYKFNDNDYRVIGGYCNNEMFC